MAKYTPTKWQDSLFDEEGNRVQKGTALSASNLNKIEGGIAELDQKVADLTYEKPSVTLALNPSPAVREFGDTAASITLTATITKKSQDIEKLEILRGASVVHTNTSPNKDGGAITYTDNSILNATTIYKARVHDAKGSVETSKTVTFVYPSYAGVTTSAAPTQAAIKVMTKLVTAKTNTIHKYTANGERFVLAYPKSYGVLTSILDPNNFETINSYARTEVDITGLDGTVQAYYVYTLSTPTTQTNFANTYKY